LRSPVYLYIPLNCQIERMTCHRWCVSAGVALVNNWWQTAFHIFRTDTVSPACASADVTLNSCFCRTIYRTRYSSMAFRPRVSTDVPLDAASFEEQFIAHVTRIILHLSQARPHRLRYGRSLIFLHRRCRYRAYFLTFLESC